MNQNSVQESTLAWLFNPFPSSILDKTRQDLNPQPLDRESSPLTTRPDLRPIKLMTLKCLKTMNCLEWGDVIYELLLITLSYI